MTHYDEHTLTLYVLGHESVKAEREAIATHLAECRGCSEIAATLRLLHAEVGSELEAAPAEAGDEPGELMRIPGERTLRRSHRAGDIEPAGAPIGRRVMRYAYRHPVTSGAAVLVAGFLLFLSGQSLLERAGARKLGPPAMYRVDDKGTAIEICDHDEVGLWSFPVTDGRTVQVSEAELNARMTRIVDLDGNGGLNVVTSTAYPEGERSVTNALRIFSETGTSLNTILLGRSVTFRGGEYPLYFQLSPIVVINHGPKDSAEIITMACNYRSPCGVYRINARGEVLGEYWHYGWVRGICARKLSGMDHDMLILCGANEVRDAQDSAFACIIVLDPRKISGVTEGTASRGFGFGPSKAEMFYIRAELPRIPVNPDSSYGKESFTTAPIIGDDGSLIFRCVYRTPTHKPMVLYSFDDRMALKAAFLDDNSREVLRQRYLADHSPQAIDRFLEMAHAGVSYWDGREWTSTPARVTQSRVVSSSD